MRIISVGAVAILAAAIGVQAIERRDGDQDRPVFTARADAVLVTVFVRDGERPVANLGKTDFRVTDNGVPQAIDDVVPNALPIDASIVVDASFYSGQAITRAMEALRQIANRLRPGDRLRLIVFGRASRARAPYVSAEALQTASAVEATGFLAKNDAIQYAITQPRQLGRRHLVVVFTNGERDLGGATTSDVLPALVSHTDATLHVVLGVTDFAPLVALAGGFDRAYGTDFLSFAVSEDMKKQRPELRQLFETARVSGGLVYETTKSSSSLGEAFQRVMDDFTRGYLVQYQPQGVAKGGWHELAVKLAAPRKYTLVAPKGYFGD